MSNSRKRGRAARIYKEIITNLTIPIVISIILDACKTINENMRLMVNRQSISEKKKNKKPHLPYSTLNPETSSLSPSAKSKGVRPSSISHNTSIGSNSQTRVLPVMELQLLLMKGSQVDVLNDLL